jgi:hypothetical protein
MARRAQRQGGKGSRRPISGVERDQASRLRRFLLLTSQDQCTSEEKMLISFSMIVLTSQLVIAVADNMPQFNIERGCRVDSASAFDAKAGMNATIKRCVEDEQQAMDQLQTQWSGFTSSDRAMCTSETVGLKSDKSSTPPSYVELLTCLQDQELARKLRKE